MRSLKNMKIFGYSVVITLIVIAGKYFLHQVGVEPIEQTSLHNSLVSSAIFVIGFVLAATITDYKESERIPSEFAATIEDMYEDGVELRRSYKFDLERYRLNLIDILVSFREGTRKKRHGARSEIVDLQRTFGEMTRAGVPPNYVTKLKQQQSQLLKSLFRVNYIQRIKFIPSAFVLIRSIVVLVVGVLMLTNIEPFYGGLMLTGAISFIMIYVLILIQVISVPFQAKGSTFDDISVFQVRETRLNLSAKKTNIGRIKKQPEE